MGGEIIELTRVSGPPLTDLGLGQLGVEGEELDWTCDDPDFQSDDLDPDTKDLFVGLKGSGKNRTKAVINIEEVRKGN